MYNTTQRILMSENRKNVIEITYLPNSARQICKSSIPVKSCNCTSFSISTSVRSRCWSDISSDELVELDLVVEDERSSLEFDITSSSSSGLPWLFCCWWEDMLLSTNKKSCLSRLKLQHHCLYGIWLWCSYVPWESMIAALATSTATLRCQRIERTDQSQAKP